MIVEQRINTVREKTIRVHGVRCCERQVVVRFYENLNAGRITFLRAAIVTYRIANLINTIKSVVGCIVNLSACYRGTAMHWPTDNLNRS